MIQPDRLPYPGLRAYARDETDLFFGREGCVNEMVDRLAASRFLAVLGASGSGKSSLVRTGLLDGLELGLYAAAGPLWAIADCHPGGSALRNLAAALLLAKGAPVDDFTTGDLEAVLRRGPLSLVQWVEDGNLPDGHNLLLLIDQFEELFRYAGYAGREEAEALAALLLESTRHDKRIHVVITMRSEYLGACALIPGLAEQINRSLYLTRRMTRAEIREAIEGPAAVAGFDIEPKLVSRILNDLATLAPWEADREQSQLQLLSRQADQLPLMQHALSRLWQLARRRSGDARLVLTLQDYLDIGQLQGAIDQHANEVMATLDPDIRPSVRLVFRSLVAGTHLEDAVRRPLSLSDLLRAVDSNEATIRGIVDAFRATDCNFLRPSGNEPLSPHTVIDISHESLIRQWRSLTAWFADEAKSALLWSRLLQSEERHAAGEGELQAGLDLANALAWWQHAQPTASWASNHGGRFHEIDVYLQQSRARAESQAQAAQQRLRRERRTLQAFVAVVSVFAVVCGIAAFYAWNKNIQYLAATRDAQDALAAENKTYDMALTAADRFGVAFAERLQVAPGVSSDEVRSQLNDGKALLDSLAEGAPENRRIAVIQAKFIDAAAVALQSTGQIEDALKLTQQAEAQLLARVGNSPLATEELFQLLEIQRTTARELGDLGRYDAAVAKAQQAADRADAQPKGDGRLFLEQGKAHYQLAFSLGLAGKYRDAAGYAHRCLDDLARPEVTENADRNYYIGRCHIALSYTASRQDLDDENERESRLAVESFVRIPDDVKSIPMLIAESTAISNLGWNYMDSAAAGSGKYSTARAYFRKAAQIIDIPLINVRQNVQWRIMLMDRFNNIGRSYSSEADYPHAREQYARAAAIGFIDDKWIEAPNLAAKLQPILGNLSETIGRMPWQTDPDLLKEFEQTHRQRIQVLDWQVRNGHAKWCMGCALPEKQERLAALLRFDRVLGTDRYGEAMALADEIIAEARAIIAKPPSERHAVNARRAWFWTVSGLIADPADVPAAKSPQQQIERLTASRTRVEAFLSAYPHAWLAEQTIGRIDRSLAKLFEQQGRKGDAVASARAGADLFDRASIELLAQWYRTGSGPTERDLARAATYETLLAARNWGHRRVVVPARLLWLEDPRTYPYTIYLEDPRSPHDNPLERELWQLQTLEGVKLPDDVAARFDKTLHLAKTTGRSFVDLLTVRTSQPRSADLLLSDLNRAIDASTPDRATNLLATRLDLPDGPQTVTEALDTLFDQAPKRDFVPVLSQIADRSLADHNHKLAGLILNAILARPALASPLLPALYRQRAMVRTALGDPAGAEADLSLALTLQPDDPGALGALADLWIGQDRRSDAAITLLHRALLVHPADPALHDSLGWALVKAGDTEPGLAQLLDAAAERPDQAVIAAHVGDAYRRLGRNQDAVAAFTRAAALANDGATDRSVADFIRHQQALLDDSAVTTRQADTSTQTANPEAASAPR